MSVRQIYTAECDHCAAHSQKVAESENFKSRLSA
jgi:hypothetical protein